MRFTPLTLVIAVAILSPCAFAQYSAGPAAGTYASIQGVPGAAQLAVISACDDCVETVPLSFSFPWFGTNLTSITVSSNGAIIMDASTGNLCCSAWALDDGQAGGAPVLAAPVDRISVVQEDLDPQGMNVWMLDTGVSMIISYEAVSWFPGPASGSVEAQVELFANGAIEVRFGAIVTLANNFVCGTTSNQGGVAVFTSAGSVLPEFNAVGQTTGGISPQNTGVLFQPSAGGSDWQTNSAASSLDIDGLMGNAYVGAQTTACVGGANTLNSAATPGTPSDIAVVFAPHLAAALTLTANVVNIDINDPTLFNFNGGAGTFAGILNLQPHPGAFSFPIPTGATLTASAQQLAIDGTNPDGFVLSQAPQLDVVAGASITTTNIDDGFNQIILSGSPLCATGVQFYGTTYTDLYQGSNGDVTFTAGSTDFTATSGEWQTLMPRIGFQSDLQPNVYGTITVTNNGPTGVGDYVVVSYQNVTEWGTAGLGVTSYDIEFHGPNGHSITNFVTDGTWGASACVAGISLGSAGTHPALASFATLQGGGLQANVLPTDSVIDENPGGMILGANDGTNGGWISIDFPLFDGSAFVVN